MSTAYIFNGFGRYEEREGVLGYCAKYAGVEFWLPYRQVKAIPNFAFRELDHDKSTPEKGVTGVPVYKTLIIPGERVAEEITKVSMTIPLEDMGIRWITGRSTGRMISVLAGWQDESGAPIYQEVLEKVATPEEEEGCLDAADVYKQQIIQDYLQSKRERLTGSRGQLRPAARVRAYMDELGVEDIDDVTAHAKNNGLNADVIRAIIEEVTKSNTEQNAEAIVTAIRQIRAGGNTKPPTTGENFMKQRPKSQNLAAHAAEYDRKQAEAAEAAANEAELASKALE